MTLERAAIEQWVQTCLAALTAGDGIEALAGPPPKGSTPSALDATISSITARDGVEALAGSPPEGSTPSALDATIGSITARDVETLTDGLAEAVKITWSRGEWQGRDEINANLQKYLAGQRVVRVFVRRLLIDVAQAVAAVEWVARYLDAAGQCHQLLGGVALDFDDQGRLVLADIHLDMDRSGLVDDIEADWPAESWQPGLTSGRPPSRAMNEQLLQAHASAWSSHQVENFAQVYHEEVHLVPPWAHVTGRAAIEAMIRYHFATFEATQVTIHRVIYDPAQPHFGVCQQTFACTNPETGQRGQDSDFAFFEVCQGKLRYWRNYFDSQASVQDGYKELGPSSL